MEKVLRFTTSSECRMAALVRHFGDVEDAQPTVRDLRRLRSGGSGAEALPAADGGGAGAGAGDCR
jgi:hypothetical protein